MHALMVRLCLSGALEGGVANRVDLEVPLLSGTVQIDDDFFVRQLELFESDVCAVGPWAEEVCVQCDLRRKAVGSCRGHS